METTKKVKTENKNHIIVTTLGEDTVLKFFNRAIILSNGNDKKYIIFVHKFVGKTIRYIHK